MNYKTNLNANKIKCGQEGFLKFITWYSEKFYKKYTSIFAGCDAWNIVCVDMTTSNIFVNNLLNNFLVLMSLIRIQNCKIFAKIQVNSESLIDSFLVSVVWQWFYRKPPRRLELSTCEFAITQAKFFISYNAITQLSHDINFIVKFNIPGH